jgi:hypothetical protein
MTQADFEPEWIWGDDAETIVFAQGYGLGHTTVFSCSLDSSKLPSTLSNRTCTSFHSLEAIADANTFPNADSMRQALWEAVRIVWPQSLEDPSIDDVDAVVGIDSSSNSHDKICWRVYHHPLFPRSLQCLDDEGDGTIRHMIRGWHNSEELLRKMPPHPNILPAPLVFVTIFPGNGETTPVICGSLQPFYTGGDVGDRI